MMQQKINNTYNTQCKRRRRILQKKKTKKKYECFCTYIMYLPPTDSLVFCSLGCWARVDTGWGGASRGWSWRRAWPKGSSSSAGMRCSYHGGQDRGRCRRSSGRNFQSLKKEKRQLYYKFNCITMANDLVYISSACIFFPQELIVWFKVKSANFQKKVRASRLIQGNKYT